jgi:hypothetical protein
VDPDSGALHIESPGVVYSLLISHAERGVLLGAALMYEMLKGAHAR